VTKQTLPSSNPISTDFRNWPLPHTNRTRPRHGCAQRNDGRKTGFIGNGGQAEIKALLP
jgi:hypothetical protein